MKFTNEQSAKAKAAKSVGELIELAKAENIELSEDDAEYVFSLAHAAASSELPDEELENVSGGVSDDCYKSGEIPKFNVGDRVKLNVPDELTEGDEMKYWIEKKGTVTGVSAERSSDFNICKEWRYTVKIDGGSSLQYVYEHRLKKL